MADPDQIKFNHVGVAVAQIEPAAERFRAVFGAAADSPILHDPQQGVHIQFLRLGNARIELLAPAGANSPVDAMLRRGISIYHVCFEAVDFDARLAEWVKAGATLVSPPKPAIAFGNRRVAFVMCLGLMIELVDAADSPAAAQGSSPA